jgi:hypothetical protein
LFALPTARPTTKREDVHHQDSHKGPCERRSANGKGSGLRLRKSTKSKADLSKQLDELKMELHKLRCVLAREWLEWA